MLGRYLQRFLEEGTLHTPKADNAKEECKKVKGIAKLAAQVCCLDYSNPVSDSEIEMIEEYVEGARG